MSNESWVISEAKNMALKDKRRNDRVTLILQIMSENLSMSIPQASKGKKSDIKAIYCFINSECIDVQNI